MFTRRGFLKLMSGGFVAFAALAGFPVFEAMATPRITRYSLTPPNWTAGLKLRIVAIADLHACEPWMTMDRVWAICQQANALKPDIFLLLGDYVRSVGMVGTSIDAPEWAEALGSLSAPLGVHAILGNHDCWADPVYQRTLTGEPFAQGALRKVGIPVYVNQSARLEKDGKPFWLIGLGDQLAFTSPEAAARDMLNGIDDLPLALTQVTDDAPIILMAHEPDIFPDVDGRISLTLSGHTHGGQINLFGWTPIVPSRYGNRYVGGHIVENGRNLIVSRGLGCSSLPIRFGSWPEILEIEVG